MGLGTILRKAAQPMRTRRIDEGLRGADPKTGATGGSFSARARRESPIVLDGHGNNLNDLGLPGEFSFTGTNHLYTDQYDRQITLTADEVAGNAENAIDRICHTYEQEALRERLGRQYGFDTNGDLVFSTEINGLPVTAILTPGQDATSIYLPEGQDDRPAIEQARKLLPATPGALAITARRAAATSETWDASPRNFSNNPEARATAVRQDLDAQIGKHESLRTYGSDTDQHLDQRVRTLRAVALDAEHPFSYLMPARFARYFADSESKHFSSSQPGSTFTGVSTFNELLNETFNQRGTLQGDDRDDLIARGADPTSFAPDKRYLMVETDGLLGAVRSSTLPDNTPLQVVRKSAKTKPVCVARVAKQAHVTFATIVVADNPSVPGTEESPGLLISAFPGASTESGSSEALEPLVGNTLTIAEARKLFGREFSVNTVPE